MTTEDLLRTVADRTKKIRVETVGVSVDRGWASMAHIPAIGALRDTVYDQHAARRRRCLDPIRSLTTVPERRVCRVLGPHRSTQRRPPRGANNEAALTKDIIALARQHGLYRYRRVTALLRNSGGM